MLVPPWLESLLSTSFFSICPSHHDAPRNECNMYCLDCGAGAFCYYCRTSRHKDHFVIQIRRSSYHDVVRVAEIQNVLDISGVQTYVINSARVLFLNERPQPKVSSSKGVSHLCEICGRSLLDPFRFCSLGCKLVGVKRSGEARFISLGTKNGEEDKASKEGMRRSSMASKGEKQGGGGGEGQEEAAEAAALRERFGRRQVDDDVYPSTPPPPTHNNSRRRKGVPRRASFGLLY